MTWSSKGRRHAPNRESDTPRPLNAYGRSKGRWRPDAPRCGARRSFAPPLLSPPTITTIAAAVLDALDAGRPFAAAVDHVGAPTFVPALVDAGADPHRVQALPVGSLDEGSRAWSVAITSGDSSERVA